MKFLIRYCCFVILLYCGRRSRCGGGGNRRRKTVLVVDMLGQSSSSWFWCVVLLFSCPASLILFGFDVSAFLVFSCVSALRFFGGKSFQSCCGGDEIGWRFIPSHPLRNTIYRGIRSRRDFNDNFESSMIDVGRTVILWNSSIRYSILLFAPYILSRTVFGNGSTDIILLSWEED